MVRDIAGNYYVGGRMQPPDGPPRPVLFQLRELGD
jgi:hypothetical protein